MQRVWPGALFLVVLGCGGGGAAPPAGGGGGSSGGGSGGVTGAGSGGAPGSGGASGSGGAPGSGGGASGSGGAAGSPDAALDAPAPDGAGAGDAGASAGCPAGALLCDDFEGYANGPTLAPNWMTDTTGGTVQVDGTKPFSGAKAVHISATAGVANLLQIWKQGAPLFPVPNNTFYGRVMMWLSRQPTGGVHFNTVQANGMLPGSTQIAKYAYGAMYSELIAGYTVRPTETALPTVDCGKRTGTTGYPVGRWVCAEWKFDGANDELHYWLDGVLQTAVDVVKGDGACGVNTASGTRWQAPVFNKVMLGWYSQVFPMPVELWMDDVVLSSERVGCPKAP
ncbi:MAG TPA: hypothetical protein VMU50_09320 [Polyangia bacterium]|nr:hypothetical protein [Polyangia bacterium]